MELEEAKELLNICNRWELRDHAFGDREVGWTFGDREVASGYFGGSIAEISIYPYSIEEYAQNLASLGSFKGNDAYELVKCGVEVAIERNDETGPETFTEGKVMPGLTKDFVFTEITTIKNLPTGDNRY